MHDLTLSTPSLNLVRHPQADRPVTFGRNWGDSEAEPVGGLPAGDGGWRNPSYAVRVVSVGAVWALPGVLAGLMANLILGFTADPVAAAAVGAVLFAVAGGRVEAAGS